MVFLKRPQEKLYIKYLPNLSLHLFTLVIQIMEREKLHKQQNSVLYLVPVRTHLMMKLSKIKSMDKCKSNMLLRRDPVGIKNHIVNSKLFEPKKKPKVQTKC
jgi:hypothetical protein